MMIETKTIRDIAGNVLNEKEIKAWLEETLADCITEGEVRKKCTEKFGAENITTLLVSFLASTKIANLYLCGMSPIYSVK